MNLISHELKHCEQFGNILRTGNIGVSEYARAITENSLKRALDKSSFDIMLKSRYEQALKQGKGEEFMKKTRDMVSKIKDSFNQQLAHLYQEDIIDTNAEMKVFDSMIKSDGYGDSDFKL